MEVTTLISGIRALLDQYETELVPQEPEVTVVGPADDIQAAFALGRPVHLMAGQVYPGITVPSGATLVGNGAEVRGVGRAALYVAPGSSSISISDLTATSDVTDAVVQLGDNSSTTQGTVAQVPTGITLTRITVPTHRGRRAFGVHAVATLLECSVYDTYSPAGSDSQGVWIHNTPGPVYIGGGTFEAGSENIMIGGDTAKISGNIPTGITVSGVMLRKPLSWQTDGINRYVKNLFEVKAGRDVRLLDSTLDGCWQASQTGWAIVITPKNSLLIDGVLIDGVTVRNVGGGVQFMGLDYNSVTPAATRGVIVRNSSFTINRALFGGTGRLALYTNGMLDSTWENVTATFDGSTICFVDSQTPTGPFTMRGCHSPTGAYGFQAPGANYGNVGYAGREFTAVVEGNTFTGAPSQFRANFPLNTYL
jgi:hypothetical protein